MFDASDDMIAQFENGFFPELSRQRVVEGHRQAALKAEEAGNNRLRDLHLKYADSVKVDDPDLQVDIEKAAAALSKKDYIGFLAHGVRWGSRKATGNSTFPRVISTRVDTEENKNWSQRRTVSVQHSVSIPLDKQSAEKEQDVFLGAVNAVSYRYPINYQDALTGQF